MKPWIQTSFSFNKSETLAMYFLLLKNYIVQKGYMSPNKLFFHFSTASTFSVSAFEKHFNSSLNENVLFFPLLELFPVYKSRCLERQYAFRLLENSYVTVFEKASSHKMLLNAFLNILNIQLKGRRHGSNKM